MHSLMTAPSKLIPFAFCVHAKHIFAFFFCFIVLQIFRKFFVQRITLEWQRQIGIEFILIFFYFFAFLRFAGHHRC